MMDHEKAQIERLINYIEVVDQGHVKTEDDKEKHFHDFKSFYTQYDKRKGHDFREAFPDPDLLKWYDSIEVDQSIPDVPVNDGRITHFESGEYEPDIEKRKLPPAIEKRNKEQAKGKVKWQKIV